MPDNTDYSAAIDELGPLSAQGNLNAANDATPDQGVAALRNGPEVGVPPSAALADPDTATELASRSNRTAILNTTPSIASFAAKSPAHATAIKDDFLHLQPAGNLAEQIGNDFAAPFVGVYNRYVQSQQEMSPENLGQATSFGDLASRVVKGTLHKGEAAVGFATLPVSTLLNPTVIQPGARLLSNIPTHEQPGIFDIPGTFQRGLAGHIQGRLLTKQEAQAQWARDIGDSLVALAPEKPRVSINTEGPLGPVESPSGPPKAPSPSGEWATNEAGIVVHPDGTPATFATQKEAGIWYQRNAYASGTSQIFEVANGENGGFVVKEAGRNDPLAPTGVDPVSDAVRSEIAAADAGKLSALEDAVAATKTQSRAPEITRDFIDNASPDTRVWLPAEALAEMVAEGKWVPTFNQQAGVISSAITRGADIEMSLGQYLAETAGTPLAEELRPHLRLREDGISQLDGEELAGQHTAQPPEEPPVPTGMVRMYHGGEPGDTTGPLWFTSNRAYAADRQTGLHYVDVPADSPLLDTGIPDQGIKEGFTVNRELPTEIASQRKRIGEAISTPDHPEDISPEDAALVNRFSPFAKSAVRRLFRSQYLLNVFASPEAAGMQTEQFALHSERVETAVEKATKRILDKAYTQIRRERGDAWKNSVAQRAAEIEKQVWEMRDIQARSALLYNEHPNGAPLEIPAMKLKRSTVVETFGQHIADALPRGMFGKDGFDADAIAYVLGYDSGSDMIHDLVALTRDAGELNGRQHTAKLIQDEAQRAARAELGFDISRESIEAAAREIAALPEFEDILVSQLKDLAKVEGLPFDKLEIKELAKRLFSQLIVKDAIKIKEFERVMARTGRTAEIAIMKGDALKAFRAKQQQLINHYMLAEAHILNKQYGQALSKFKKWARKSRMTGVAQAYLNYVHAGLIEMGFPVKRNLAELIDSIGGTSLTDFVAAQNAKGYAIVTAPFPSQAPTDMSVEDFQAAYGTLQSLIHNGRLQQGIIVNNKRVAFESIIARAVENFDRLGRKLKPNRLEAKSVKGTTERAMRGFNAPNIRAEQLIDEADVNDPVGPLNQAMMTPLQKAKGLENDLTTKVTKAIREFNAKQPKGWLGSMDQKIDVPELLWEGERRILTKGQLIRAALNWGNRGNREKLLQGYGWDKDVVEAVFDRYLKKEDWDFVQFWWDQHEEIWPYVKDLYRNLTGLAPAKVEPLPFTTAHGEMKGGYYALSYDNLRSHDVKNFSQDSLFGEDYNSALPANPYTKNRTNYLAPLNLTFETVAAGLGQVIHDIAFREALLQAQRVVVDPRIKRGIQENFGPEYYDQLKPWLEYTARERVFDERSTSWLANVIHGARINITNVGLMYRVSSALIHGTVAMSDSVGEIGLPGFSQAMADMYKSPKQLKYWTDYITTHSAEIRNRALNMDRDIREAMLELIQKQGFIEEFQKYGYHMLAMSDQASAMPTWLAALRQATESGLSFEDAVATADKRVRQAHGASAPVDLPALLRSGQGALGELGRTSMMFLSFQNHAYNRLWRIKRQAGRGFTSSQEGDWAGARRDWSKAAAMSWWYVIVPAVAISVIRSVQSGRPIKSGASLVDGIAHTTIGALPFVSDILALAEGREPDTPIVRALKEGGETAFNAWKEIDGKGHKVSKRWLQHTINTVGYLSGVGLGQVGTTAQYVWDWGTGHEHPKDLTEVLRGIAFGPHSKGH